METRNPSKYHLESHQAAHVTIPGILDLKESPLPLH